MKHLALIVLVLSLAACPKDAPPTGPGNTGGSGEPAVEPRYACTADDDCAAVELECCDACNGGEAVGVNKQHVDEVLAESPRGTSTCDVACTRMGCAEWVSTCEAGRCAIARGSL